MSAWVCGIGAQAGIGTRPPAEPDEGAFRPYLFEVLRAANWPVMERQAITTVKGLLAKKGRSHIVFIDDLDRCGSAFTCDVLAAASFWVSQSDAPVYFIIAVSKEHLLKSLEQEPLGRQSPAESLEKYIHHSVTAPTFLTGSREVVKFQLALLNAQLGDLEGPDQSRGLLAIRDRLQAAADGHEGSGRLLWPVIEVGMEPVTPRRAVDRLNVLLRSEQHRGWLAKDEVLIKEIILGRYWPEFFGTVIRPLQLEGNIDSHRRGVLAKLSSLGSLVEEDRELGDSEAYARVAESIVAQSSIRPIPPIDLRLLRYLAMKPSWEPDQAGLSPFPPSTDDTSNPAVRTLNELKHQIRSGESESQQTPSAPNSTGRPTRIDTGQVLGGMPVPDEGNSQSPKTETRLEELHWRLDVAASERDNDKIQQILSELLNVLAPLESPDARLAPTLGNIALVVEKLGLNELARYLHLLAHRADPSHVNVTQNLVEFALDSGQQDMYSQCSEWLTSIASSEHKPWRTALLRLRLSTRMPAFEVDTESDIRELLTRCHEHRALSDYVNVIRALTEAPESQNFVSYDVLNELAEEVVMTSKEPVLAYQTLRILADYLAASDSSEDEDAALDIYCWMLSVGLPLAEETSECLDVQMNTLTLIASRGNHDNAVAAELLRLHRLNGDNIKIARGLARALKKLGDDRNAVSLLQGRLSHEPVLNPPEEFRIPHARRRWWVDLGFQANGLGSCGAGFPCTAQSESST